MILNYIDQINNVFEIQEIYLALFITSVNKFIFLLKNITPLFMSTNILK